MQSFLQTAYWSNLLVNYWLCFKDQESAKACLLKCFGMVFSFLLDINKITISFIQRLSDDLTQSPIQHLVKVGPREITDLGCSLIRHSLDLKRPRRCITKLQMPERFSACGLSSLKSFCAGFSLELCRIFTIRSKSCEVDFPFAKPLLPGCYKTFGGAK